MIASCGFLEEELRQFSREEGVTWAASVETLGVAPTKRLKRRRQMAAAAGKKSTTALSLFM